MTWTEPEYPMPYTNVPTTGAIGALAPRPSIWARLRRALVAGWFARFGLPVSVSIGAHVGIAALIILSGLSLGRSRPGGYSRTEIRIDMPNPMAPAPSKDPAANAPAIAPAPVEQALPRLQGFTTPTLAAAPVLRSSAGDWNASPAGALESLKRTEEAGLGATFAGMGAKRAASVVYVVDASGAMVSSLRFVFEELNRSVSRLGTGQKFAVVLFRDRSDTRGPLVDVFSPSGRDPGTSMVAATPANKAALRNWLANIRPTGRSNPLDGVRRGLAFPCDAVFLLSRSIRRSGGSDGAGAEGGVWGRGTREILAELDRLNPRDSRGQRRVVIKAIQFLEEDPTGTMQAIGSEHGDGAGSYRVLPLEALTSR